VILSNQRAYLDKMIAKITISGLLWGGFATP